MTSHHTEAEENEMSERCENCGADSDSLAPSPRWGRLMVCGRCSHHTEAVRVVAEAIKKWLYTFDAQGVDRADDAARAAVEALYAATVEPDCPTCGGRSTDQSDLAVERFNRTGNLTDCPNPDCSNGKLPSRYLVVVDAERDGKLVRHPWSDAVLCEVPPEEGADR